MTAGVNILQKEEDFVLGILGVLLGRIPGFSGKATILWHFYGKQLIKKQVLVCVGKSILFLQLKNDNLKKKTP